MVKVALVAVIALTVFVGALRPVAHPARRFFPEFQGFTRMSLLSESPDTDRVVAEPSPATAAPHFIAPPLVIGLLLFVLRVRRVVSLPIRLHRLRLSVQRADHSPSAH